MDLTEADAVEIWVTEMANQLVYISLFPYDMELFR